MRTISILLIMFFISSCNKESVENKIIGSWDSEIELSDEIMNDTLTGGFMIGIMSSTNYNYTFNKDKTGLMKAKIGGMVNTEDFKWELKKDTLITTNTKKDSIINKWVFINKQLVNSNEGITIKLNKLNQ